MRMMLTNVLVKVAAIIPVFCIRHARAPPSIHQGNNERE
jgi:hypothetical protein